MNREQAIEMVNEYLEEDVTENFSEAEERKAIDGNDFFHVMNSNNATVRVDMHYDEEEDVLTYEVITDDVFNV